MLKSIEGIYRDGRIQLLEEPEGVNEARVIVTFVQLNGAIDLGERGIDEKEAANLRARLNAFAEDWERPEMEAYDGVWTDMTSVDDALRHTLGL